MMQTCGVCHEEWHLGVSTTHVCRQDAPEKSMECGCSTRFMPDGRNLLNPCATHAPLDRFSELGECLSALKSAWAAAHVGYLHARAPSTRKFISERLLFGKEVILKLEQAHKLPHWTGLDMLL